MEETVAIKAVTSTAERGAAALRSPVGWALLGLVIQRPSYGYELVQRFERIYEDALELSSISQIYKALDALKRRGLIEEISPEAGEIDHGRQPKPHYRSTQEGVEAYRTWLVAQPQQERRRSRLFALQLAMLAPEDALAVIDSCERTCLEEAAETRPNRENHEAESASNLAERLVGEEERLAVGARLAWIEYTRRQFETFRAQPPQRR